MKKTYIIPRTIGVELEEKDCVLFNTSNTTPDGDEDLQNDNFFVKELPTAGSDRQNIWDNEW